MQAFNVKRPWCAIALLLLGLGASVHAATLSVNCGGKYGLTSINAALKAVQSSEESHAPATINVSGACHENVVIQSIDRLTLNAVNGASVTDASGGTVDVILIGDSRSVSINNFTIKGSAGGASGITCRDGSLCRLNGNTVQGAVDGAGVLVGVFSQLALNGGALQNNGTGLFIVNGASGFAFGVTIQNNPGNGIELRAHSFLNTDATIAGNSAAGVFLSHNSTLNCVGCQVNSNGDAGVIVRRDSTARFSSGYVITGNKGAGVLLTEESSAYFPSVGTVTGNGGVGGTDVVCGASFTTAKFATTHIGGGSTNCVEPSL
jgi:hypothetical protein